MQRFDYTTTAEDRIVNRLTAEHFSHVQKYLQAPASEKYPHYMSAMRVWNRLRDLKATSEAHRLAVNFAFHIGLVSGVGIPRW